MSHFNSKDNKTEKLKRQNQANNGQKLVFFYLNKLYWDVLELCSPPSCSKSAICYKYAAETTESEVLDKEGPRHPPPLLLLLTLVSFIKGEGADRLDAARPCQLLTQGISMLVVMHVWGLFFLPLLQFCFTLCMVSACLELWFWLAGQPFDPHPGWFLFGV